MELPNIKILNNRSFANFGGKNVIFRDLTTIYEESQFENSKIQKIDLGERVTKITKNMFKNCKNLIEITIPETVTEIESDAFTGCDKLVTIYI